MNLFVLLFRLVSTFNIENNPKSIFQSLIILLYIYVYVYKLCVCVVVVLLHDTGENNLTPSTQPTRQLNTRCDFDQTYPTSDPLHARAHTHNTYTYR